MRRSSERRWPVLYGFLKYVAVGPLLRAIWRPWTEGVDNVPSKGAAILASNHLSFCDSFFMPVMVPRRVTFLAKSEYFTTPGLKGRLSRGFFRGVGQVPVDREDADAAKAALDTGVRILGEGHLLGIYPEGPGPPTAASTGARLASLGWRWKRGCRSFLAR